MAVSTQSLPDGIKRDHASQRGYWQRHASPMALLILLAVVVSGVSGALGHERTWEQEADGVKLNVHAPEVMRNGELLEMRIGIETDRPIGALAIGLTDELWTDMTVNTLIPAAAEESNRGGEVRFEFGRLEAGDEFLLKVDLQANPDIVLGNSGRITVYDNNNVLVATPISITVLP